MSSIAIGTALITFIFAYLSVNIDKIHQQERDLEIGQYTALQMFFMLLTSYMLPLNSYVFTLLAENNGMTELAGIFGNAFLKFSLLIALIMTAYMSYYFIFVILKKQKSMFR